MAIAEGIERLLREAPDGATNVWYTLVSADPELRARAAALKKTYDAVPAPKIVIAVGACAISGGPFSDHPEVHNGADAAVPVDLYIPGCPPHPLTILDALLRLLGRREEQGR